MTGKIAVIAVMTGLLAVGIGALALVQIGSVANTAGAIYDRGLVPDQDVAKIRETWFKIRHASLSKATAKTPEAAKTFHEMTAQYEAEIDRYVKDYLGRSISAEQKELAETFHGYSTQYRELRDKADAQAAAGRMTEWEETRTEITMVSDGALATLDKLSTASTAAAEERLADARSTYRQSVLLVVAIAGIGLLLATALSIVVARSIIKPLRCVRDVLNAVADGDLTQSAEIDSDDELGEMGAALDKTVSTLHDVIQQISGNASDLSRVARAGSSGDAASGYGTGPRTVDLQGTDEQLAEMADNLDTMISLFVTRSNVS
ncbi:MAG: MCP four helix bundle domain-containing protein [Dactylosporangium sp.]|nr:MCP four helix bundle domain-containing protein [Dactylosporangium sp.]